jgi:hypothetical protein
MSGEQTAEWKQNLQQLVQQGRESVPAIVEFLKQNKDVDFGSASESLGYASARRAMFDAMAQIGGPEAISGTLQTLQNTADPREIALLAQNMERMAPEQHREEALQAARETLVLAASGKLQGTDVGPLFEVLQNYGGSATAPELQQAATQWNYYATIALAQLPEGAGIPALIQIAQGSTAAKGNALEMLTQTSAQYPEARTALLEMARANKITPNQWPYLTPLLAGDQYHYQDSVFDSSLPSRSKAPSDAAHVLLGNQHFYTSPGASGLTADQINQQTALINDLVAAVSDPAAVQALQKARDLLARRGLQTVAVSE